MECQDSIGVKVENTCSFRRATKGNSRKQDISFRKCVLSWALLLQDDHILENNDPKPPVELIKKTLKIYPYQAGGLGTSIAEALSGQATLLHSADGKLEWSFLKPQPPVKFIEGSGMVINTVPPNDYSYFQK